MVNGRTYVTPEDIKAVAQPVLAHRMTMNVSFDNENAANAAIIDILNSVDVPTEDWGN